MPIQGCTFAVSKPPMPKISANQTIVPIEKTSRTPKRTSAYGIVRISSENAVPNPACSMTSGYEWRTGASGWLYWPVACVMWRSLTRGRG